MNHSLRFVGFGLALAVGLSPIVLAPAAAPPKTEYYQGKVMPLADAVKQYGVRLDADAAAVSMVLVTDDGKIYPLLKDDGSRMFFKDKRLLNRPMRLTARPVPGSQLLQVLEVHSYVKGQLCEVYYWCEICAIKRFENKICDCCGGPMELREVPVVKSRGK